MKVQRDVIASFGEMPLMNDENSYEGYDMSQFCSNKYEECGDLIHIACDKNRKQNCQKFV